jgi:hypothetical protein
MDSMNGSADVNEKFIDIVIFNAFNSEAEMLEDVR